MMLENPYKYMGPLDPVSDWLICIPRQEQLEIVIKGVIKNDEFWAVLGPRQIGKTTFLRQIEKKYPDARYIYFNFEISPNTIDSFYQWGKKQIIEKIPHESAGEQKKDNKKYTPEFNFLNFLEKFRPKESDKKIVLLLDEIERVPSVASFLHLWRKLYHDRYHKEQLNQYGIVMTGSVVPLNLTLGSTSPFNISQTMYLNDLSEEDSRKLIERPFDRLGISIDEKAKKKLISYLGGHPQILQQSCYFLVNQAANRRKTINEKDIPEVFNHLLIKNSVIDTLMQDIKTNHELNNLLLEILTGKKKKYFLYKEFSIAGAGAIIEDRNSFCKIRNKILENCLKDLLIGANETTIQRT
jgi:predicted AAA+ superfamily ATPase